MSGTIVDDRVCSTFSSINPCRVNCRLRDRILWDDTRWLGGSTCLGSTDETSNSVRWRSRWRMCWLPSMSGHIGLEAAKRPQQSRWILVSQINQFHDQRGANELRSGYGAVPSLDSHSTGQRAVQSDSPKRHRSAGHGRCSSSKKPDVCLIEWISTIISVSQDIWEQSRQGTMELLREVLWTWNESLHNFWTGCLSSRLLINCLQFASIVLAYCWAKDRGLNVAAIVFAATAFYVYRYLDDDCHRVSVLASNTNVSKYWFVIMIEIGHWTHCEFGIRVGQSVFGQRYIVVWIFLRIQPESGLHQVSWVRMKLIVICLFV